MTTSGNVQRITYEAFSRFSNNLNQCRSFEDLEECFTIHLKYFFNYHLFRASYAYNQTFVHLESLVRSSTVWVGDQPVYNTYELRYLHSKVPLRICGEECISLQPLTEVTIDMQPELWLWNFSKGNKHMMISVLGSVAKRFTEKDITFLKLVSESLEAKLLELCLIKELDEKNEVITLINKQQEQTIKERTREIAEKNETLLQISILNAHNVREPLSRIIGLINLVDDGDEALIKDISPMLRKSSNDLDLALQSVINRATSELEDLKA